jgi:uncharacterized protein (DUF302 family)
MRYLIGLIAALVIVGCTGGDEDVDFPEVRGAVFSYSTFNFADTYGDIVDDLEAAGPISIVAQVDHQANAASVNEDLEETRTVFFGNPALGTPFMQQNQQAGLDLPQKFAVYTSRNNASIVIYNSPDYINNRHGTDAPTSDMIAGALDRIASNATGTVARQEEETVVARDEGIVTRVSNQNFEETYSDLLAALNSNPNITVVAELDHQENAASVDMELRPTRVVIFGNPSLGTPLLQKAGSIALDLPQKMLVYQSQDGAVNIAYNDADYIAARHNVVTDATVVNPINIALANLASIAAGD